MKVKSFAYLLFLVSAHHSTLPFDGTQPTRLAGVVTKFAWQNPHCYIDIDVKDGKGKIEHWTIESESLSLLQRLGWSKDLLKAGDHLSSIGARARNGSQIMRCKIIELSDGRKLPCFPEAL